jgi:hypothetical protein
MNVLSQFHFPPNSTQHPSYQPANRLLRLPSPAFSDLLFTPPPVPRPTPPPKFLPNNLGSTGGQIPYHTFSTRRLSPEASASPSVKQVSTSEAKAVTPIIDFETAIRLTPVAED